MEGENKVGSPEESPVLGRLYEAYIAALLQQHGWIVRQTKAGADQGADLLLYRSPTAKYPAYAVQCKGWIHGPVGNEAVQAVFAAKAFYEAERALLVAFQGFTQAAQVLAEKINVGLVVAGDAAWAEDVAWPEPTPAALSHEAAQAIVLRTIQSALENAYPLRTTGWEDLVGYRPPGWTLTVTGDRMELSPGEDRRWWVWTVQCERPAWRGRPPRTLLVRVQLDPYTGEVLQTDGLGESKLKES